MIVLEELSKSYGAIRAVHRLDLEVRPGEVFGFLGPNGAGKTTTIRMMAGLLQPSSGRVVVGGYDMAAQPEAAKRILGYVPDRPFLYERLSAIELLRFLAGIHRLPRDVARARALKLLGEFDLLGRAEDLVQSYSHGMKQRLAMCASLLHDPQVLVVDEPMVGLDPRGARFLKSLLRRICREQEKTVFLSTHSLEAAEELCDRLGIIHHGELVACGTLAELRQLSGSERARLEEVFFRVTAEEVEQGDGG
ncbi:MAG: ABC transporter ATP-binding protein [Deltaproteobacteria bacterium]|nr:ABC transporter ATP-binding protein [Deltaproteobacteria bacterium]